MQNKSLQQTGTGIIQKSGQEEEGGLEMPPNLVQAMAAQSPKNELKTEDANAKGADDNLAFGGGNEKAPFLN